MKFAYFVEPHLGGTFTLFRHLRAGLAPHGVDVQWVGTGRDGAARTAGTECGFMVASAPSDTEAVRAAALIEALKQGGFDGVFINVLADRLQMNIARYLPSSLRRIMIVHNITPGTYAAARSIRDNVHATVGVSERCRRDLVHSYGFPAARTVAIPNAVDTSVFSSIARKERPAHRTRLLFLGRIEDAAKGVFWLPAIMDCLRESVFLSVAGTGADLPRLMDRSVRHARRVRFLNDVQPERVPHLMATHDVLIMPSRYEGFGFTIIEAMAAGCVPVVSRISGVTDMVVEDGVSGLLFPVGDWGEAARLIALLDTQPALLAELSLNARRRACSGFDLETMAKAYLAVIEGLFAAPTPVAPALPLQAWSFPRGLRDGFRSYLPRPVKNWLRTVKERA